MMEDFTAFWKVLEQAGAVLAMAILIAVLASQQLAPPRNSALSFRGALFRFTSHRFISGKPAPCLPHFRAGITSRSCPCVPFPGFHTHTLPLLQAMATQFPTHQATLIAPPYPYATPCLLHPPVTPRSFTP